jgi:hypothetical protein
MSFRIKNKKKQDWLILSFFILGLFYTLSVLQRYSTIKAEASFIFGYMDYQNNWRGLNDFLLLKVPFRDYFYEYGWFFLALQAPAYWLFGKTFQAVLISREIYLALLAIMASFWVGRNVLDRLKWVLLFMFFMLLFRVNYDYTSLRHLMAELSLSFFIFSFLKKKDWPLFLAGIFAGLSVLSSLEYGVALNLALGATTILVIIFQRRFLITYLSKFALPQIIIVLPFFAWLHLKKALLPFWQFTYGFIRNFYQYSPCSGESFPRLDQIETMREASRFLIFGFPVEWLQKLNFYFVILASLAVIGWSLYRLAKKRKKETAAIIASLLAGYGLLISTRTLINPCFAYFTYSLTPFFLLLTMGIRKLFSDFGKKSLVFKRIILGLLLIILIWFFLNSSNEIIKLFLNRKPTPVPKVVEQEYYPPAGIKLDKPLVKGYQETSQFILENTNNEDYLFVYPWGPYNSITGREPASSMTTNFQYKITGKEFELKVKRELEERKPKFVVINLLNTGGVARYGQTRDDVFDFIANKKEAGPVFSGRGNEVEWHLLENYQTLKKFDELALVMAEREQPIELKREFEKVVSWPEEKVTLGINGLLKKNLDLSNEVEFDIIGNQPFLELRFPEGIKATHGRINLKLSGSLIEKYLSLYFIDVFCLEKDSQRYQWISSSMAIRDWQEIWLGFAGKEKNITHLRIRLSENKGFLEWLRPRKIIFKEISLFYLKENEEKK